tara:strand:- start:595 stop:1023 length:429 start_codon:yes stop_codon:yes gene_type:complete
VTVELMKAVFGRLTSNDGGGTPDYNDFYDAVGGRIYAVEGPANATFPLCIYNLENVQTTRFFGGRVQQRGSIAVGVFAKAESGPDSIVDIEKLLFNHLDEVDLTVADHDRGFVRNLTRGTPSVDDELIQIESTFEITATSNS